MFFFRGPPFFHGGRTCARITPPPRQQLIEELQQLRRKLAEVNADRSEAKSAPGMTVGGLNEWTFDALPDLITILDSDHRIQRVNRAMAERLGVKPIEAVGLTCHEVVHGLDEPADFCPHTKMLADGKEHRAEVVADRLGGTFLVTVSPIRKPDGSIAGSVHVARDITARKQAEEALAEKTMMLDNIMRSASTIAIATTDLDFRIIYYNPAAERFFGYTADQVVGRTVMEVHTRENVGPERFERAIEAVRRDGEYCYSVTQHLEDGSLRELESRVSGIFDTQGTMVGYCLFSHDVTEHKRVEEVLRGSERKYRLLAENTVDFIFQMDLKLKFNYMSPSLYTVMGYHPEEVVGTRLLRYTKRLEFIKIARQALGTLKNFKKSPIALFETALIHKNGGEVPVEISGRILLNEDGKPIGYQGNVRDISERRRADKALRDSEAENRAILEAIPDLIFLISREGVFLGCKGDEDKFYLPPESFLNRTVSDIMPDDLSERTLHHIKRALESETIQTYEYQLPMGGNVYDWEARMVKYVDDTVLTVVRDITERKRAAEALRESEEKYRNLIQHSNDAIYLLYDDRFEIVNDKFQEIFGLTLEDVNQPGFSIMDLVAPGSRAFIEDRAGRLARGETLSPRYEFSALSKDGNEIEVEVSTSYLDYKDGIAIQGILRDITESRRMEQQLRQAQKMESVGTLTGGIAHDFNNLLTVISGHAELGLMNCGESHPVYPHIMAVLNAGNKAANLTRQLLAFSRKQITELKIIDINQLIHDLDKMMRRLIGEDFSMEMVLPQGVPLIKADTTQIEQIMVNLIVNARDAINQQTERASEKKITIETSQVHLEQPFVSKHLGSRTGSHVMISVSDNGIGMDEETRSKILDPFFTTKEKGGGTGLGMATVYGIVKQNGGCIYIYSEPGEGTTIKIYWPASEETTVSEVVEITGDEIPVGTETILVVEDDPGVRKYACLVLRDLGYRVHEAANGRVALALVLDLGQRIDLLITDLVMPEMNGKELALKIAEMFPEIRILFASGYTDNHIVHSGSLDEGIDFIHKPFSVKDLARRIREILDRN